MFTPFYKNLKKSAGNTLVELLIVVTLSLLLISFLFEMYTASQRGYQLQIALNHLQDNAKTAIDMLNSDIRKAGYIGCSRLTNNFPVISYSPYLLTSQTKLMGKDEEISIQHMEFPGLVLKELLQDNSTLYVSNEINVHKKDILVISDCQHAELFQVENVYSTSEYQKITTFFPLHNQYKENAEIGHLIKNRYFVAKTNRKDKMGLPIYSLFVEDIKNKTELVEGVKRIKLLYSILNGDNLIELQAKEINDWSRVVGVAIELEMVSFPLNKIWHSYVALLENNT